jgi:hypothetical protein
MLKTDIKSQMRELRLRIAQTNARLANLHNEVMTDREVHYALYQREVMMNRLQELAEQFVLS